MKPFLDENILKDKTLGAAVSGGGDSMALLNYLYANRQTLPFGFVAVTVNHGIRGKEGERDAEFVENYCKARGIDVLRFDVDAPKTAAENGMSEEVAARVLRYDCFFRAVSGGFCDVIATAHHSGDNAETVLLNLLRGTGLKGVSGMDYSSYSGKIIRPLLGVTKAEIERYLADNKVDYVTDSTNFCSDYTRNFVRNELMPKIEEKFPAARQSLLRFAETARLDDELLCRLARDYCVLTDEGAKILPCAEKPLFFRAAVTALKAAGAAKDYETVHLQSLYSLQSSASGSMLNLHCGLTAYKDYDGITVTALKRREISGSAPFKEGEIRIGGKTVLVSETDDRRARRSGGELYADADKIPPRAILRARKEGDIFKKFGGGSKKLKSYLIDKKFPARERGSLVVLADGEEVLAILGVEISEKIKIDENTKRIYKIEIF